MKTQTEILEQIITEAVESNGLNIIELNIIENYFYVEVQNCNNQGRIELPISLIEKDFLFSLFKKISESK